MKLEDLVTKYAKIHDEGPGRRFMFTWKESNGLTDLHRRIGLHEQMLQIWYINLIYGSLRRLEGGQEDILRAIEAIKNWGPRKVREVQQSLQQGDIKPLERELSKSGLELQAVVAALGTAVDYVDAPPREQVRMESHARSSTTLRPEASNFASSARPSYPEFSFDVVFGKSYEYPPPPPPPHMHRSKSTSARKPRPFYPLDGDDGSDFEWREPLNKSKRMEERHARERLVRESDRLVRERERLKKEDSQRGEI